MRYSFFDPAWPSFADIVDRLTADTGVPSDDRAALLDDVRWLIEAVRDVERFANVTPASLPFAWNVIDGLLRAAAPVGSAAKIRAVRSGLQAVLARYSLTAHPPFCALQDEWERLFAATSDYRRRDIRRFLLFLTTSNVRPSQFAESIAVDFRLALIRDPSLRHPENEWIKGLRAWNWAHSHVAGWPSVILPVPTTRPPINGLPWSTFRTGLRDEVEVALRRKPKFVTWDKLVDAAYEPDPNGLAHGVELIRICLGALVRSGIPASEIRTLRDFSVPDRFRQIALQLFQDAGGQATRLVRTKLARLHTVATRSGVLTDGEILQVREVFKSYCKDHKAFCKKHPSRIEDAARQLDSVDAIALVRNLILHRFSNPPPSPITRKFAAEMKQAAMLALRLGAPGLTTVIIRKLIFARHFTEMDGAFDGRLKLFVPQSETPNCVAREAIFSNEDSEVLRCFVENYRNSLDISGCSPYLFPGTGIEPLGASTICAQQIRFLEQHLDGRLKPSVIRKLIEQLLLDAAPFAIEFTAATMGLCDLEYLSGLAEPYQNDHESRKYGRLVTEGRLRARSQKSSLRGEGSQ